MSEFHALAVRPSAAKVVALEVLGEKRKVAISIEVGDTLAAASKQVSWETKREESCCRIKVNSGRSVALLCAALQRKQLKVGDRLPPRRHECRRT